MPIASESHSFRRLLNTADGRHREYVLSRHRYAGILQFLGEHLANPSELRALDIGCGAGVITRGLAERFAQVTGVDQNADNVALAQSLDNKDAIGEINFRQGDATHLPVEDSSVDVALLNGVFEWVGLNDQGLRPLVLQRRVLAEVIRVLRPGGVLYLAIENRLHPRTLLRDPHTHLPLVNMLPRRLANVVSERRCGRPFQAHIYGHRKLHAILANAGFVNVAMYSPFPGYQHPLFYVPLRPRKAAIRAIASIDAGQVGEVLAEAGRAHNVPSALERMHRRAVWGMLGLFTHDFAVLARKG